jgi:hypothetical protein
MRVLVLPELAASKTAATKLSRLRFLPKHLPSPKNENKQNCKSGPYKSGAKSPDPLLAETDAKTTLI